MKAASDQALDETQMNLFPVQVCVSVQLFTSHIVTTNFFHMARIKAASNSDELILETVRPWP